MKYYSQKDPRWGNKKLGYSNLSIRSNGCYLTSIAMLFGKRPDKLNDFLKRNYAFKGALIDSKRVAKLFGTEYSRTTANPKRKYPVIAETDHYRKHGFPQHFFILLPDGRRVDPLDPTPRPEYNNYNIVSYRDFGQGKKTMKTDKIKKTKKAIKKYIYDFGNRISTSEDEIIAHKIEAMFDDNKELQGRLLAEKAKPRISYKGEFNDAMDKLKECKIEYDVLFDANKKLEQKIKNQAKEITSLKALNEKNAKKATFWDSFVFLIKTAIKK
ncbi:MAG TPA: hypothetical protein ENJ27_00705 [Candidatus Moranbacteria bacterium]|nr:hypothetical protein [Candidatus Moranbacteria bacterium]